MVTRRPLQIVLGPDDVQLASLYLPEESWEIWLIRGDQMRKLHLKPNQRLENSFNYLLVNTVQCYLHYRRRKQMPATKNKTLL